MAFKHRRKKLKFHSALPGVISNFTLLRRMFILKISDKENSEKISKKYSEKEISVKKFMKKKNSEKKLPKTKFKKKFWKKNPQKSLNFSLLYASCLGHKAWVPEGCEGKSQAGPKGCQLEVRARRAPKLLYVYINFEIYFFKFEINLCKLKNFSGK